jgi:UDP-N-acetyl-D-mannosaminuronic acid dehydrogenase|tara:strand:- start:4230 stop:5525 length:1296 start_codon:yes stop_codon:yes gene_type:complete
MQDEVLVIGLGRIGLPVALVTADSGLVVRGVDASDISIASLKDRKAPFEEPGLSELIEKHAGKNFLPMTWDDATTADFANVRWIVVTIGVHVLPWPEPADLSIIYSVINGLMQRDGLKGRTLILRTTLPVGTTSLIADHIEETTDLVIGKDFNLAFIPERLVEGMAISEERSLPKIIGPVNAEALTEAKELFSHIGGGLIEMSNSDSAEFVKLIDNAWRHTRFAFANDAAVAASANGVDIIEVINAANQDYDRNSVALPGPVSGYCLGKDPLIFEYAFQNVEPKRELPSVWLTALRSSQALVPWTASRVKGNRILVAGLSFKEDVDDFRMSFSEPLIEALLDAGHEVSVCDPELGRNAYTQLWPNVANRVSVSGTDLAVMLNDAEYDTVIMAVRHSVWKDSGADLVGKGLIIDLWNSYRNVSGMERIGLGS